MKNNLLREILIMSKPLFYVIFLQALFVSFLHAEESSAQRKSLYEIKISLEAKDASVIEVFKQIEDKTDFIFTYNDRFIESGTISINRKNKSLGEILELLSKTTDLKFKRINENIHVCQDEDIKSIVSETYAEVAATVTGTVTDGESGEPLPGATILVKGTSIGTVTSMEGEYSINVPDDLENPTLIISFIGYATQEVSVGERSVIDVSMQLDISSLSEVVVTGYASQQKADLTGSVGTVKPEEITALPSPDVTSQLQGRVAGVTVSGSGQPGQSARVRIRGFSSFENNDPLYIVDGVPTQDISAINPNDIENVSVLKDAGAASIYGSRASNGVIVVTTKKGSQGIKVNYSMFSGVQDPGEGFTNLLGSQEYADLQWLVYRNDQLDGTVDNNDDGELDSETHPIYGPSTAANPSLPSWAANTNWYDAVTQNASITQHNLSLSGGNENAKFYGGLQYFNQEGIILHTYSKRYSGRFNSEFNIKDRVTIGENLQVTHTSQNGITNLTEGNAISWIYRNRAIIPVTMNQSVTTANRTFVPGEYGGTGLAPRLGNGENGVANQVRNKDDININLRLIGNVFADVKILEGLNFRTAFGGTYSSGYQTDYTFATYENSENIATAAYQETGSYAGDWVWTNTLTFDREFGAHRLLAVAGYEAVKYGIGRGVTGRRGGYFSDEVGYRTVTNGATILNATSFLNTETTLVSQFLRADYALADKYLISATVRRDGSSRFGEENKYGVFPSVSAGWRIGDEAFFQGIDFISDLKIRGGYGTMGNQLAVAPENTFFLYGGSAGSSNYAIDGSTNSSSQGFRPTRIGNPDAKWETNVTTNIGVDIGLLDNKFEIVFDWYQKTTDDLLYAPALPGIYGAANAPFVNIAQMENKGIDLQLIYRQDFTPDFRFEGNLTFTTYNNEIVKVADGVNYFTDGSTRFGDVTRNQAGHPVSSFYGYQVAGLFQSAGEVSSAPTQDGAEEGFFRFANVDDSDNAITPEDRTFIGNPNPDFTAGLNLSFQYKAFDLTAFFYTSQGNDIYNYTKWWTDFWPSFQGGKSEALLYDSWTESRTNTNVPKASNTSNFSTNTQSNSYYIEDGSFIRLKNLQIGYNLPQNVLNKIGLTSARIYLQGANLFTITDYSGLDPEISASQDTGVSGGDTAVGIDYGNYPNVKQYLIGVNIGI